MQGALTLYFDSSTVGQLDVGSQGHDYYRLSCRVYFVRQAYDEIKNIYFNYPKRGLRWSSGWIDRGGWKPQQFGGPYFYAQAETLAFHFTDDIELLLDFNKREVEYRSSTRLGTVDSDLQRLRYNQFVKMLTLNGGWDVKPLEQLHFVTTTPFRWTRIALDKTATVAETLLDRGAAALLDDARMGAAESSEMGAARLIWMDLMETIQPYITPVITDANDWVERIRLEPRVAGVLEILSELQTLISNTYITTAEQMKVYIDRYSLRFVCSGVSLVR
jgi:Protein of unknown function (DUF1499)